MLANHRRVQDGEAVLAPSSPRRPGGARFGTHGLGIQRLPGRSVSLLNQSITTSAINADVRLAPPVRPDGRRTDEPGGASTTSSRAGKRFSLPNSRIVIHQPLMSGLAGQATDIDIAARELLRMRDRINDILVLHTGQPVNRIQEDTERDYIMTAEQGKNCGIIDHVIRKRA
jgi:Clp protease